MWPAPAAPCCLCQALWCCHHLLHCSCRCSCRCRQVQCAFHSLSAGTLHMWFQTGRYHQPPVKLSGFKFWSTVRFPFLSRSCLKIDWPSLPPNLLSLFITYTLPARLTCLALRSPLATLNHDITTTITAIFDQTLDNRVKPANCYRISESSLVTTTALLLGVQFWAQSLAACSMTWRARRALRAD